MNKIYPFLIVCVLLFCGCSQPQRQAKMEPLQISANHRFFTGAKGNPFFWLGDTGWLLFSKLDRQEADSYLENRREKGFNVIQVMVLHGVGISNAYGDSALINRNVAQPLVTVGNSFENKEEYDYWDHVDYIIGKAEEKGIYMGLVPVWGSNVKAGLVSREQAVLYARWLAERYRDRPNIIWLNGGDTKGNDSTGIWNIIGNTLRKTDPNHLITFHPFGRMQSSDWFHNESWLDFNMFQSGHRRYDQDDSERHYGEDNWRYVEADYNRQPVKPTLDGEPSYEGIPQGLHDTLQPLWKDSDVRRYAYWSVFAGGCGFTYGNNSVMQFYGKSAKPGAYGAKKDWTEAINDPGAGQMQFLKKLMLSRSCFDRVPDQTLVAGTPGEKYDHQAATQGEDYAYIYTYNGKTIALNLGKIRGDKITATWFNPRDGSETVIGTFPNSGVKEFDPPGEPADGNDWVLVLDSE
jgi:hypothetical protein